MLALAGCSGGAGDGPDDGNGTGSPSGQSGQGRGSNDTWPLTGLTVASGTSARRYPVLVLKLDNTRGSAPQRGLSDADLVVEELVEGGVTRLAAFYYSDIPGVVGPVRSMRASDVGIVSPVGATMVTSGAAQQTMTRLAQAGIDYVSEGSAGFFREPSRNAPYDLMTDLGDVSAALTGDVSARPPDYLPFGPARDLPEGEPASAFDARFSSAHTTSWAYQDGGYVDTGSLAADGDEFPADSVLVLRVRVGDAGYLDPSGSTVPETKLVGEGEATLFHGGRMVSGTWRKTSLGAPLALVRTEESGEVVDLRVPPGRTWIELVPVSGGVDVSR